MKQIPIVRRTAVHDLQTPKVLKTSYNRNRNGPQNLFWNVFIFIERTSFNKESKWQIENRKNTGYWLNCTEKNVAKGDALVATGRITSARTAAMNTICYGTCSQWQSASALVIWSEQQRMKIFTWTVSIKWSLDGRSSRSQSTETFQ